MHDDLDRAVGALLHTARDLLLAEAAVSDALGVYSRYGHTPDEWRTVTELLRAG
jgi:hypothetical protein